MATQKRKILLNIKAIRKERESETPVIVDQNGVEHPVRGVSVDTYLQTLELEEAFTSLQELEGEDMQEAGKSQTQLLILMKGLISSVLPDFPVGGLLLEELFSVVTAIQSASTDGSEDAKGAVDEELGE